MSYWQDRTARAQQILINKSQKEIEKQLAKYYKRAAMNCITSFENTVDKLIATIGDGREPTPADLYKLDTYWKMQAQAKAELDKLGNKEIELLSKQFVQAYQDIYDNVAVKGYVSTYNTIDNKGIMELINSIWCADGQSWSARIWKGKQYLLETLNEELVNIVVTGKKSGELKKRLQARFSVSYSQADSLVRTELKHIQTEAAKQRYTDYGINKVQIWADKDERQCEVCGKLHEKIYPINAPIPIPAHPRCRCNIIPYDESFED